MRRGRGLWQGMGVGALLILAGCASVGGLPPGDATEADVRARMGPPAREWRDNDGSRQLVWPGGHFGRQTWMARIAPDGRVRSLENVLDEEHFAIIKPGVSDRAFVERLLGPPFKVTDFERRNEQAWEWRYVDVWTMPARYVVLFDRASWKVKESWGAPEQRWERME